MKILICSNIFPPKFIGGAEIIAYRQARALQKRGHEVRVFAGDIRDIGPRHHHLSENFDGLDVDRVRLTYEDFATDDVNFVQASVESIFLEVLEDFKPDVVHCHNLIGLSVNIPVLAKKRSCKVVLTLHDHWGFCFKNTAEREPGVICRDHRDCAKCMPYFGRSGDRRLPIELRVSYIRYALDHVDMFISPSEYLAEKYIEADFPRSKMAVLWNGIDTDKLVPIEKKKSSSRKTRFSFFGHFGRHKGLDVLIRAVGLLSRFDDVEINLVGEGDQEEFLRELAEETGVANVIRFWGKIENDRIVDVLDETDVLLLPSVWPENQPVSITEAMACGLPVIASDIGGIPELVVHEKTGLTFEAADSAALAHQMQRLIDDGALRRRLGRAGRSLIEKHSFEEQVDKLGQIYGAIAASAAFLPSREIAIVFGREAEPSFAEGLRLLRRLYPEHQIATVLEEWLVEKDKARAILACSMDAEPSADTFAHFADSGLPLLLSAKMKDTEMTCSADEFRMLYQSADDVAGGIAYIMQAIATLDYEMDTKV